jgi:polyribonucleotide nucleotidyltransferase
MSIATERRARVSVQIGSQEISFETGKLAKQADGAVVVRAGDTMVLATAQGRQEAREGADFFPLTVDVEERMYAAGKIPGGFFKREGRPTERAILTARMIDRPIRPLWPKGFRNEVQVICTVLSADMVTGHDILCINGASAALMISPLPFLGPVGAVRVGRIDGELVVNPTLRDLEDESSLDLIVVGTREALTMVEAGADEIPEDTILEAFELAHAEIVKLCDAQEELRRQAGKAKWLDLELVAELERDHGHAIWERIQSGGLREAGAVVEEVASYQTVRARTDVAELRRLLREGGVDLVTFSSSSTVRNFLELLGGDAVRLLGDTQIGCIGPITAETATAAGLRVAIQPEAYTIPALAEAILQHFAAAPRQR